MPRAFSLDVMPLQSSLSETVVKFQSRMMWSFFGHFVTKNVSRDSMRAPWREAQSYDVL